MLHGRFQEIPISQRCPFNDLETVDIFYCSVKFAGVKWICLANATLSRTKDGIVSDPGEPPNPKLHSLASVELKPDVPHPTSQSLQALKQNIKIIIYFTRGKEYP